MTQLIDNKRLTFLKDITREVVGACRVRPGKTQGKNELNTTGKILIVPGGSAGYPALWVEDLTLSLDSGLVYLNSWYKLL